MFTALVDFIQYHITETVAIFFAPLIKHCAVDSYLISFYCVILEFAEVYGIFIISFLFVTFLFFYRNSLFNVFKVLAKFFIKNEAKYEALVLILPTRLINYTKLLRDEIKTNLYSSLSKVYLSIRNF